MAEWTVRVDQLSVLAQTMEQCTHTLQEICGNVNMVRGSLQFRLRNGAVLDRNLQALCQQIEQEAKKNNQLSAAMRHAACQYQTAENKLSGTGTAVKWAEDLGSQGDSENAQDKEDESKALDILKILFKFMGRTGDIATIITALYDGKGEDVVSGLIKLLGNGVKAVKEADNVTKWAKNFFEVTLKTPAELLDSIKIETVKEFLFGKNAKPCTVAGTVIGWAGTAVASLIGNAERLSKADADYWVHMVTSTVVETGVKIVEGAAVKWAVTAAVGAVGAAVGVAGAPAWAIGAVTVGTTLLIDWGLNYLAQRVTGDTEIKWTQAVSDWVYEKGKTAAGWAKETADKAGKAISNAWGSFCSWVRG